MHTMCLNLQIRSNKLKCCGITPVYYDMRENLGYMVNISLAFFSRENIFPKKVIIWMFGLCLAHGLMTTLVSFPSIN